MGVFLERAAPPALAEVVRQALAADPVAATNATTVTNVTATAQAAASGTGAVVIKVGRIVAGIAIGAALFAVGLYLVWLGDQQAIDQAKLAVTLAGYKPPTLGIAAAGSSVITLAGAWSAALVGVILTEK